MRIVHHHPLAGLEVRRISLLIHLQSLAGDSTGVAYRAGSLTIFLVNTGCRVSGLRHPAMLFLSPPPYFSNGFFIPGTLERDAMAGFWCPR